MTGFLPSAILSGCIYVVPFAMIAMARLGGYVSRSRKDMKACNMVFYFLVGNVFFLSLLSGSLLDQIGQTFSHPKDIPSHLAGAVSAQVSLVQLMITNFTCYFRYHTYDVNKISYSWSFIQVGRVSLVPLVYYW